MAEIDSLELKITSDSTNAVKGLDALSETLDKLKSATKGGLGLTSVANQVGKLSTATNSINSITISNLKGLATALQTLSSVGNIKISSSIANQITAINTALNGLNVGSGASKITELVSALQPLETLGKSSLGTTVNALKKLPDALKNLDTRQLYTQIQSLTRIFKPLADEMQKVANGFSAFPTKLQRLIATTNSTTVANNALSKSYVNLYAKFRMAYMAIRGIVSSIAQSIKSSNDYIENLNLFNASLGEFAGEAQKYAEQVGEIMGIDPGEWMRNQGVFMTLATGFGVVSDRAYTMSKNLTQLGYDLSSFFNLSVEESMLKLQSGLAGELEPLRRIGFDLSQARLQQEAYTLGITKKISAMTQAEKAELRYHAILSQVTIAQGDMARTLNAPANQLRILKAQCTQAARAIGNIFIPTLNAILPYAIAVVKVIRLVAENIAKLFGFELPKVDYSGLQGMASGAEDVSDALDNASKSAKKLQQYTMGFDELNVINPDSGSSGAGVGDAGGGGSGFDFELPEYDFITEELENRIDTIFEKSKVWVATIGAGLAAWAIPIGVTKALEALKTLASKNITWGFSIVGLAGFLGDLDRFKKFVEDFNENGATVSNVAGMISEFAGMVGDAFVVLGKTEIGGALKVIQGIGEIVSAIADIGESGVNFDNVNLVIRGIGDVAIGIGLLTKNPILAGGGLIIVGLTDAINAVKDSWEAIKSGDWSNVEWGSLAIGAIEVIAGVVTALGLFKKTKDATDISDVGGKVKEVITPVEEVNTHTSTLTTKLKSLATNLAWGVLIVAEVAAAATIFVGSIWLIGEMLQQIGDAWQPVLDNGGTTAIAIGVGTTIIVAVGLATYGLGTLGAPVAGQIGIGIGILAELSIATDLFLAEIWAVGKLLDEIGKAWQPVLDNGNTIENGIKTGTVILVSIGVVTAALGMATVASAGTLPIAIGLGTAILIELGVAFKEFCDNLVDVADKLNDDLHPALEDLNAILPDLNDEIEEFKDFMIKFANFVIAYSKSTAISGFASTVTKIIGFFTKDPIKSLADDVKKEYNQSTTLNDNLDLANPELQTAIDGLKIYKDRLDKIKEVTDTINTKEIATNVFTDMVTMSDKMSSFGKNMKQYYDKIKDISFSTMDKMVNCMNDVIDFAVRIKNEVDIKKIDSFTEAIKDLTTAVKNLPTSKTVTITAVYKTSGTATTKKYASGGYPETGQMFIAREAGAELVGNIGRKTAVVNNEQIVASVSRGVAEANNEQNSLLQEQNSLLRALLEKETGVYLDGKRLTNSVEKYQRQRGNQIVVGGGAY